MRVLIRYAFLSCLLAISQTIAAQLVEGDIMFIAFNTDGTDGFSILAIEDIPASSTIYFNDNEWNELAIGAGGAFLSSTEHEFTWTTPASVITAGTVVTFSGSTASTGTLSGGTINFANGNEVIYAFIGTDNVTPTTFLSAISNSGFSTGNGAITNTGLTAGTTAIEITGSEDVMVYTGSTTCNSTKIACTSMIATTGNWTTQDGSGDQSQDAALPDFPDDVPASFGGTLLPVELIEFKGFEEQDHAFIQWKTAVEINNSGFEVEKSIDGISFSKIGFVEGGGNANEVLSYSFLDLQFHQSSYYRLKQIDYDGRYEFSEVIFVSKSEKEQFTVYPNPSLTVLKVDSPIENFNMSVFNISGKRILRAQVNSEEAAEFLMQLKAGTYAIQVTSPHFSARQLIIRN